ncbi:MAG: hypothetical protein HGA36_00625 [Candidatus Moranbacteria bacterium]|nr:hypothetical protein [Candidatus Moranbacteria bacterium]
MHFTLTQQAQDYLNEVKEALLLPHACGSNHRELSEMISKLKNSDPSVIDPPQEASKMLTILGKYARLDISGYISTADAFYELFHKLFNLLRTNGFIKIQTSLLREEKQ